MKNFNGLLAVDDLSFQVHPSDVYGFLGQNGAGKSTCIRMLLSLVTPSSGEIELFGLNLKTHRKEILQQVGAVVERPDLYKYLTAFENLSLFARMSGLSPKKQLLMEQLELVGLADRAGSKVRTFSQGMKQRLGIAVALVHNPRLVILDEPTNGLDPQGIADMRNLVLRLSREMGKTVLVSSHLLGEIEQVATRMLIIDKGKKMMEGTVSDLFHSTNCRVHIKVQDPEKTRQVISASKWSDALESGTDGALVIRMDQFEVPELSRLIINAGIGLLSVRPANSLEDYFLSLTAGKQHVANFTN
ncbi:ABC transporter ATP-binding protein [Flavihumibacter profundi]|uniref:ABC transporter ATP-binding protein n=1 Tax=Flavihumibacter profundi TaxID=2716883 RepID=UPI001CC3F81B|nr:ABC transporter ATP-binding protein [Flavihumibacter profundi]MBZ5858108.1 ABC transporter ATP-binding protein [Flavihumibacter profundi]